MFGEFWAEGVPGPEAWGDGVCDGRLEIYVSIGKSSITSRGLMIQFKFKIRQAFGKLDSFNLIDDGKLGSFLRPVARTPSSLPPASALH